MEHTDKRIEYLKGQVATLKEKQLGYETEIWTLEQQIVKTNNEIEALESETN